MNPFFPSSGRAEQPSSPFRNDDEKIDWIVRRLQDPNIPLPGTGGPEQSQAFASVRPLSLHDTADRIVEILAREASSGTGSGSESEAIPGEQFQAPESLSPASAASDLPASAQESQVPVAPATPGYDAFDSALLEPGGTGATTKYKQALNCKFGEGQFSASVTVINEDRGFVGDAMRMLRGSISTNPVNVRFTGTIQDANGPNPVATIITDQLAVNAWKASPIGGAIRGPGQITLLAENQSPHYTGVTLGVIRTTTS